jgi:hypothetical protein
VLHARLPGAGLGHGDLAILKHLGTAEPIELNRPHHLAPPSPITIRDRLLNFLFASRY